MGKYREENALGDTGAGTDLEEMLKPVRTRRVWLATLGLGLSAAGLAACGAPAGAGRTPEANDRTIATTLDGKPLSSLTGSVRLDGSSTVFTIAEAMAEEFQRASAGRVRITVGISGTGGGFKRFCSGETDISNASRPIRSSEMAQCAGASVKFIEVPVAFDGMSIAVSPRNTWVDHITVAELKKMWEPAAQGTITRWSQIRDGWPDRPLRLYGPGPDSGTFDYFTDAITGKEKASRGDYTASEDDNMLVQGIANDPEALGYFGFAYYIENKDRLKVVPVDSGTGNPVTPSEETIRNGTYQPLSRPVFVYLRAASLDRTEVREFMRFYLDPKNTKYIAETGHVPFPSNAYEQIWERVLARQTGTVFGGKSQEAVTLEDLLKQPQPLA
jgi:phosphate transport system substrate-binding protein